MEKEIVTAGSGGLNRRERAAERVTQEARRCAEFLRARGDYSPQFDYFLDLAENGGIPEAMAEKTGRPVAKLLCIQVPVELVSAAGFHPLKVWSGSPAVSSLTVQGTPALMCPMLRAVLGAVGMKDETRESIWVLPTTCDWVVKFPELASREGRVFSPKMHWLELPHLKDGEHGQKRWLNEVYELKDFLESIGRRVDKKSLAQAIERYQRAWAALSRLSAMRKEGRLAAVWFMLIAGSFFSDSPERWSEAAKKITGSPALDPTEEKARVFLAGSPIFFPNFKIPLLMEEVGLYMASDDLCSSERIIPGAVTYRDSSLHGMMTALAERYHQGCLCPTFIDNDRRINNILGQREGIDFRGVVFHVLKGCHLYDIESRGLEGALKEGGLKFIRLETDYATEDEGNLRTRLEAYRGILGEK
ncbi:MAG: 2-hydroxyacyl-CoA dehydratase family protein [Synergistaceae bacterium]|nr:2-hydroxyacyl-CoA dehydratase family protein [Synergistaceae bacterium]